MLTYERATVEGRSLYYATEGTGPPLLLLHGLGFDHRVWAAAAPYLAGHFRLIIPDLPGFGRSHAAGWDGSPDALIRASAGLLTATQAVPGFVAGVGIGGTVALALAARYPERVRALVVVGAPALPLWPRTAFGAAVRGGTLVPGLGALLLRTAPRLIARAFLRAALSIEPPGELIDALARMLRDQAQRQALVNGLARLDGWRYTLRMFGGVRAPALLVWGERDRLYPLPAAERLRHVTPGAQLVTVAGAGHLVPLDRPGELAAIIRQFLGPAARTGRRSG